MLEKSDEVDLIGLCHDGSNSSQHTHSTKEQGKKKRT